MKNKSIWLFAFATLLIGFMISLHLNIKPETEQRDTRDLWEIRTALQTEQERRIELQEEFQSLTAMKNDYDTTSRLAQIQTLQSSIKELMAQAGLTRITVPGLEITWQADFQAVESDEPFPKITSELLNRFLNELNLYGATAIAVEDERIVNHSAIRDVSGRVYVNQRPIRDLPVTIKVTADDLERLSNYLAVSQSREDLLLHNITIDVEEKEELDIPAFSDQLDLEFISITDDLETGDE